MTLAEDIYESIIKDPDLEVGPNQTREEFAKQEADQRAKQHHHNVEALSLANEPLKNIAKSPLVNLIDYINRSSTTILNIAKEVIDSEDSSDVPGPPLRIIEDELIAIISERDEEIRKLQADVLEIKQAAGQTVKLLLHEAQKRTESNILPSKDGESAELSTAYARDLAVHQKRYKSYMAPKTEEALIDALIDAEAMGADIEAVIAEVKAAGDNFGSPEKVEELVSKSIITL